MHQREPLNPSPEWIKRFLYYDTSDLGTLIRQSGKLYIILNSSEVTSQIRKCNLQHVHKLCHCVSFFYNDLLRPVGQHGLKRNKHL